MSDKSLSDSEIVLSCLGGQKGAWEAFVGRFSRLIYWSIHRILQASEAGDRQDLAEDIYQDVFQYLLAKEELSRLRESKNVRRYLCVIAAHRAQDKLRALRRTEGRCLDLDLVDPAALAEAPAAPNRVRDEIIGSVLATLKPKERFCLALHYYEERPHREIAALMGLPLDTVSSTIRRAREKLKERFLDAGLKDF